MSKYKKPPSRIKNAARDATRATAPARSALHKLFREGQHPLAEKSAREMINHYPNDVFGWKVLGAVLQQQGKLNDALAVLTQCTVIDELDAEAWYNVGCVHRLLGQVKEAESSFRAALEIKPAYFEALENLGELLREKGQLVEAEQLIRHLLTIKPSYAAGFLNLGSLLKEMGHLVEAEKVTRHALELEPAYAEAQLNLGAILQDFGRLIEAEAWTRRALETLHCDAAAWYNLSVIQGDLKRYEESRGSVSRALEIKPDFAVAWSQLAAMCLNLGETAQSNDALQKAIQFAPERTAFRIRYAINALPIIPVNVNNAARSITEFSKRIDDLGVWLKVSRRGREVVTREVGAALPFYLAYRPGNHRALLSKYGDLLERVFDTNATSWKPRRSQRNKIRLLIVSAHLRRHSVWDILLKGLVRHLDRSKFELFFYHLGKQLDDETVWAKSQADKWRDASTAQGSDGWLDALQQDQPDVIYYPEIGMDSTTVFLASHRMALLQLAGWGHPITSGIPTLDCYLSGELIEGVGAQSHYREELILLPGTGCCTEIIDIEPEGASELQSKLQKFPHPRFIIPQSHFKFDPADDEVFAKIAARVGECSFLFPESKNPWAVKRVLERIGKTFRERGLDPDQYLKLVPWLDRAKFYALLDASDIFLDCPSFSGYTTAWQAAHRGLPIVTLEGEFMRQRLAAGLLRQIGQIDTIAKSRQAYIDIAVKLALEAREATKFVQRRSALKAAASQADHRIEVVRAFELSLINQLTARQALPEGFSSSDMQHPEQNVAQSTFDYPWQQLDADLHFHSLKHDYAPVGLLQMIPPSPREVLDVGCFCGGSGRWLKNKFPTTRVTGIEMLEKAAEVARQAYDEVHVGKFENIDLTGWQGKFDVIVAADVLEHMYNPWAALQKLRSLLAPGGVIYISLPNIRNLNILMGLASGEWRYAGAGILDITHIRFFTRRQILEMLQQTGWVAQEIKINPDPRLASSFKNADLDSVKNINAGNLKLENLTKEDVLELMTLQFFVRAIPANLSGD